MAEQFPLYDVNTVDPETDSEYLHTPVDLPYGHLPVQYRPGYPVVESHRYVFGDSEDVVAPMDSSAYRWQLSAAGCNVSYGAPHPPPELMRHNVAIVEDTMDQVT